MSSLNSITEPTRTLHMSDAVTTPIAQLEHATSHPRIATRQLSRLQLCLVCKNWALRAFVLKKLLESTPTNLAMKCAINRNYD